MQINFLNIIILLGISQGIFLALFLLLKPGKALVNLPLVIYILLMSVNLMNTLLLSEGISISLFGFEYIIELCNLAYGLLIFIYTRNKLKGKLVLKRGDLWLFIPFGLYFVYYILFYKDIPYQVNEYLNSGIEFSGHIWEWIFEVSVNIGFLIASLHLLQNYHKLIRQSYSTIEKINFTVTRNLLVVCFIVYGFEALLILLLMVGFPLAEISYYIIYALFPLTLIVFGYNELIYSNSVAAPMMKEEKYKKSALKNDSSKLIADHLQSYMKERRPYLNPDITLTNLAELIGEHPHILSQVINENFNQNYYEFINSYRIEEAKRILKEPEYKNYTLTAIGFEAGFNSKSAFYAAFKKSTGVTPAKY